MKKWLVGAMFLAMAGLGLTAPKETVVTLWGLGMSPDDKGTDDMIRAFEAKNPDIRVRLLSMGAGEMNPQKLMTAIVGGVPPDVVRQDRFTLSDWASRGAFLPLDDLIARDRDTDSTCPTPEQYYTSVWGEAQYEGQVYGIPIGADNRVLYYNKKIFRENAAKLRAAGLDPERPPRTWSETLAYSKVLTVKNPDGTLKRAGFMPNYGNSWLYLFSFQMNANFLSPDGKTCTFYSPQTESALKYMIEGYDLIGGFAAADRFQSTFRGAENDPFLLGQVAMVINGDWVLSGYFRYRPELDFGTAPAPAPDDRFNQTGEFKNEKDKFITWAGGFAYAMPRGARNKEAAWKLIKFITSQEGRLTDMRGQQKFEKSRGRRYIPKIQGHIGANEAAVREFASGNTPYDEAIRNHVGMMPFARIRPASFAAQALWDNHVRAADRAMRKFDSPADALKEAQGKVQLLLDEENQKEKYPVIDLMLPFYLGIAAAATAVIGVIFYIRSKRLGPLARQETKWGYIFISPWIVGFLVFTLGPMTASFLFSFTQYNVLNPARFVGLKNYIDLLTTDRELVIKSFNNILYLAGYSIPLGLIFGLLIALLLNRDVKGMKIYRTLFYLPAVVPAVVSVILWLWILNADPARGLVNFAWDRTFNQWFEGGTPNWMGDANWTKPSLILMGLWGAGSGMILWLAGLKGISPSLYEAAGIDGASPRQQFWSITIPQLSPLIFFNVIMGIIGAVQSFDSIYIITRGIGAGPNDSLLVPVYHLFTNGFGYFRMGYSSALAWIIFIVIMGITFIQFKLAPRWVHTETK